MFSKENKVALDDKVNENSSPNPDLNNNFSRLFNDAEKKHYLHYLIMKMIIINLKKN